MTWTWLIALVAKFLSPIVKIISGELRDILVKFIIEFHKKALVTPNGWDDFLAELLAKIFSVSIPKK